MSDDTPKITGLLQVWRAGNPGAGDQLMEAVYGEVRGLARR